MSDTKRAVGRPKAEESRAVGRPKKRIPVSGHRDILTVEGKENGYVYRWVNDVDNRLHKFQAAGYDFVDHDVDVGVRSVENNHSTGRSVVNKPVGRGLTAYLMRIPEEFYNEDQDAKQNHVDATEADMKRTLNSGRDGTYGSVKIER